MIHFSLRDIGNWDRFYRAHFLNCLSGFKSATLIGSVDKNGAPNLAIFSNVVHLGADPALIGFINRPKEAAPHTLSNIEATGIYTMNHLHAGITPQAHQTSAKYAEGVSEFEAAGLRPEWHNWCTAPFVAESHIKYALKLEQVVPIQQNNTFLVIGSVQHVLVPEELVEEDGFLPLEKAGSMASLGISGYYEAQPFARLPYAKP